MSRPDCGSRSITLSTSLSCEVVREVCDTLLANRSADASCHQSSQEATMALSLICRLDRELNQKENRTRSHRVTFECSPEMTQPESIASLTFDFPAREPTRLREPSPSNATEGGMQTTDGVLRPAAEAVRKRPLPPPNPQLDEALSLLGLPAVLDEPLSASRGARPSAAITSPVPSRARAASAPPRSRCSPHLRGAGIDGSPIAMRSPAAQPSKNHGIYASPSTSTAGGRTLRALHTSPFAPPTPAYVSHRSSRKRALGDA